MTTSSLPITRRHPIAAYVFVTFAITWGAWGSLLAFDVTGLANQVLFVIGGLGPFLAALIMRERGDGSVRTWLRDIFSVRLPVRYYLVAFLLPLALLVFGGAVHVAGFGGTWSLTGMPPLSVFPILFVYILLLGGGLEEPGWRGHLQPLLARSRSTLVAAVIVGVIWAVWHLPLFFLPGTIQSEMTFWLYAPNVVGLSVIFAYLTRAAGGSVVPAILLHAAINSMANYYPVGGAAGAVGTPGYVILTAIVLVTAVALAVRFDGGRLEATVERPA